MSRTKRFTTRALALASALALVAVNAATVLAGGRVP